MYYQTKVIEERLRSHVKARTSGMLPTGSYFSFLFMSVFDTKTKLGMFGVKPWIDR